MALDELSISRPLCPSFWTSCQYWPVPSTAVRKLGHHLLHAIGGVSQKQLVVMFMHLIKAILIAFDSQWSNLT
jgi:hypothetical protein